MAGTHSTRDRDGDAQLNAAVYGPDGRLSRRFLLGDGIDDVQATQAGDLWVSYTYEGVMGDYGRRGWGRLSPDEWVDPVGVAGLARFDAFGNVLFEFAPPADLQVVSDCYALNSWGQEVWASYHPSFPIIRVGPLGEAKGWSTDLTPPITALAVDDDRVLLHCRMSEHRHRCWLGRLGRSEVCDLIELDLVLGDGEPVESLEWVLGRGATLYGLTASACYRVDVAELARTS